MRVVRGGYIWQLGSVTSLATETTGWHDSSSILAQTWPQKQSQSA